MVPVTTLISIDGGIGTGTIAAAAEAGADVFVCGSSIFDQSDYRRAIAGLRSQAVAARNGRGQAQA
jgi:ribulose-phosphate 3-epimerase